MFEDKAGFVRELGELLATYTSDRTGVTGTEYNKDIDGFEAVTIYFESGSSRSVNITHDSCIAIMNDVYKALI